MPHRHIKFLNGSYYHFYNRGVNHSDIFIERENYHYLLRLIKKNFLKHRISMIAYCLMPNHYHLFVRPETDDSLSTCLKAVFISYVQAFNKQYGRSGPLFEGRFRSILVGELFYMLHLYRYIHLNPVVTGLVDSPEQWEFSNYREWIGLRNGQLVDREFVSKHFKSPEQYKEFIRANVVLERDKSKWKRYIFPEAGSFREDDNAT